ncbi:MAG TPA: tetratricopeptide repeat protein [Terriglobales bacterium]|nr:tetratricopeptide repeat protein [Terriglobales bacterium]
MPALTGLWLFANVLCFATSSVGQDPNLQKALTALQNHHLNQALDILTAAEREHSSDARIRNFRGIVLVQLGRDAEAEREYREAIRIDPGLEEPHKNLGYLEWTEHNLEDARVQLKQALDLAPDDNFAHYYLGRVQLDAKLYESAFQELDRSGVSWPSDPGFLIQTANGYRALHRQEEARKIANRLSTMPLSDGEVVDVAWLLLSVNENDTAINLLRELSKRENPARPSWARFDLALTYLMNGNYENSAEQANIFLKLLPSEASAEAASAWSLVGIASAHLDQGEVAVHAFRQAAKFDTEREEHWLNLTRELMELNHNADAISAAQEGLGANPKSYALHLRLGAAYLSVDRYHEAENIFRQLADAGDPLPTSYVGLAQVLLRTGRAEDAVSELTSARQKLGPNFLISYFQGLALVRAAKPAEAVAAFQEAIRLSPNSPEAHLGLGKTELALGRISDATAELQETLRLSPGNMQAQRLLSQAYRRSGDAQTASRYAEQITEAPPSTERDLLGDFLLPEWKTPRPNRQ